MSNEGGITGEWTRELPILFVEESFLFPLGKICHIVAPKPKPIFTRVTLHARKLILWDAKPDQEKNKIALDETIPS